MVSLNDGDREPALTFSANSRHSGGTARGSVSDAPGSNDKPLNQSLGKEVRILILKEMVSILCYRLLALFRNQAHHVLQLFSEN